MRLRRVAVACTALGACLGWPAQAPASFAGANGDILFDVHRSAALDPMSETCSTSTCGDQRILRLDPRTGRAAQLGLCAGRGECHDGQPAASPGGGRVAFNRTIYGPAYGDLYVAITTDLAAPSRLIGLPALSPVWAPTGEELLVERDAFPDSNLWVLDLQTEALRQLTFAGGYSGDWSARNVVAYVRVRHPFTPRLRTDILTVPGGGGRARRVTRSGGATGPSWSPHGTRIAYAEVRRRPGVYVMRADGARRRRLTRSGTLPAWSPDGRQIAFVRGRAIYVMRADGSRARRVYQARRGASVGRPSWRARPTPPSEPGARPAR